MLLDWFLFSIAAMIFMFGVVAYKTIPKFVDQEQKLGNNPSTARFVGYTSVLIIFAISFGLFYFTWNL